MENGSIAFFFFIMFFPFIKLKLGWSVDALVNNQFSDGTYLAYFNIKMGVNFLSLTS